MDMFIPGTALLDTGEVEGAEAVHPLQELLSVVSSQPWVAPPLICAGQADAHALIRPCCVYCVPSLLECLMLYARCEVAERELYRKGCRDYKGCMWTESKCQSCLSPN